MQKSKGHSTLLCIDVPLVDWWALFRGEMNEGPQASLTGTLRGSRLCRRMTRIRGRPSGLTPRGGGGTDRLPKTYAQTRTLVIGFRDWHPPRRLGGLVSSRKGTFLKRAVGWLTASWATTNPRTPTTETRSPVQGLNQSCASHSGSRPHFLARHGHRSAG
jgi:hypothetical protein